MVILGAKKKTRQGFFGLVRLLMRDGFSVQHVKEWNVKKVTNFVMVAVCQIVG